MQHLYFISEVSPLETDCTCTDLLLLSVIQAGKQQVFFSELKVGQDVCVYCLQPHISAY